MKISRSLSLLSLALCAACASQPPAAAPPAGSQEISPQQACQDPRLQCSDQPITLSLHFADGHAFKQVLPPPIPLVQYDHVYLFPGQTLYIEADVKDDTLTNLRMVATPEHPEKTLVLSFEQSGSNGGEGMMFSIHQPFNKTLKYHAAIMDFDASPRGLKPTSSCPVLPGVAGYESWPEPVVQVMVGDFRLLDPNSPNAMTCD